MPRLKVKFNRKNLFARDGNRCQYCGKKFSTTEFSLDHLVPRSRGGRATWDNIVCACLRCNVRKGGRTPREAGMRLVRDPVEPKTSPVLTLKLSHRKSGAGRLSWIMPTGRSSWSKELVPGRDGVEARRRVLKTPGVFRGPGDPAPPLGNLQLKGWVIPLE